MTEFRSTPPAAAGPSRRQVLRAGTGIVAGIGATSALTACAGGTEEGGPTSGGAPVTVAKSDVPVGGGVILPEKYVVTQPTAGQFKAFNKTCPHQGCAVSMIHDQSIVCTCHTSLFGLTDGKPTSGPARTGLREVAVSDNGDTLQVG